MKSLMYHYIRPGREDLPYFRYLHVDDFCRQLDYLEDKFSLISKDEFIHALERKKPVDNAVVLTFDDGLTDHYDVMQILADRGLWGIFYIPTGCYQNRKLLNVHRVHMLLGTHGGMQILGSLKNILTEDLVIDKDVLKFHDITYTNITEKDQATAYVKKLMNFSVLDSVKTEVLDQLMETFFLQKEEEIMSDYYLNEAQIKSMHDAGMVIGAHSVTHPVFSKLSFDAQHNEIKGSFDYLENIVGSFDVKTFCYPYGGNHVFNDDTLNILNEEKCQFTFSVEQRDIEENDLENCAQYLPRYDCNQFPFGKASLGMKRPEELAE